MTPEEWGNSVVGRVACRMPDAYKELKEFVAHAVREAVEEERESCAKTAEKWGDDRPKKEDLRSRTMTPEEIKEIVDATEQSLAELSDREKELMGQVADYCALKQSFAIRATVEEERESCAKTAEKWGDDRPKKEEMGVCCGAYGAAKAIRARSISAAAENTPPQSPSPFEPNPPAAS